MSVADQNFIVSTHLRNVSITREASRSRRACSRDSLLGADDAGQLVSICVRCTGQRSTPRFHRVQNRFIILIGASCGFRRLVHANGGAAPPLSILQFSCQISWVLSGPAARTIFSCRNHYRSRTTWHVAYCTRRRLHFQRNTAVVRVGEDFGSSGNQGVRCTPDRSSTTLMSRVDSFPLRLVVQTQEVGDASAFVVERPSHTSFEKQ